MLDRVTFPLTTAQISEFVLDKEYTNFLTLQTAISELMETGLAESRTILNRTQLQITDEGRDTLHYFENRISDAIKSDIIDYFKNHKLELRNESSIQGNFYKLVNTQQYCVYVRVFYYPLFGTSPPLYFSSSSGSAASFLIRFICSFIFTS